MCLIFLAIFKVNTSSRVLQPAVYPAVAESLFYISHSQYLMFRGIRQWCSGKPLLQKNKNKNPRFVALDAICGVNTHTEVPTKTAHTAGSSTAQLRFLMIDLLCASAFQSFTLKFARIHPLNSVYLNFIIMQRKQHLCYIRCWFKVKSVLFQINNQ